MMNVSSLVQARQRIGEICSAVRFSNTPHLISRWRRPYAVLVSPDWYNAHRGADDPLIPDLSALSQNA